ncbi:uncharacterized protein [Amphiura filiformis]|uniref:uncharacterized protein n=1 Tax=Amphiura filiformis TaxID=82378 RepID=UPI003B2275D1
MGDMEIIAKHIETDDETVPLLTQSSSSKSPHPRRRPNNSTHYTPRDGHQDEPENSTDENYESYNASLMIIFLLGSCGAAVALLPIMVSCTHHSQRFVYHIYNISYVLKGVYVGMATAFCTFGLFKRKRWIQEGRIRVSNPTTSLSDNVDFSDEKQDTIEEVKKRSHSHRQSVSYAVVGFGIGSIMYLLCQSIRTLYTHLTPGDPFLSSFFGIFATLLDAAYIVSLAVQIVFYTKFKGVAVQGCAMFHIFIALMITGELWVWFTLTLFPIYRFTEDCSNKSTTLVPSTNGNASTNDVVLVLLEDLGSLLKPFFGEFLIICLGILFNLYGTMDKSNHPNSKHFISVDNNSSLLDGDVNDQIPEKDEKPDVKKILVNKRAISFVIAGSLLICVTYIAMFIILSGHFKTWGNANVYIWNIAFT